MIVLILDTCIHTSNYNTLLLTWNIKCWPFSWIATLWAILVERSTTRFFIWFPIHYLEFKILVQLIFICLHHLKTVTEKSIKWLLGLIIIFKRVNRLGTNYVYLSNPLTRPSQVFPQLTSSKRHSHPFLDIRGCMSARTSYLLFQLAEIFTHRARLPHNSRYKSSCNEARML